MPRLSVRTLFAALMLAGSSYTSAANIEKLSDDDWLLVKSANFEIVTDLDQEKGQRLVEDLEAYRYFFTRLMKINVIAGIKPLKVFAIGNTSNFSKLDLPDLWAGVFTQGMAGYAAIANVDNYRMSLKSQTFARQVLFHEYNHFMVRFTNETVPVPKWYDEGMAEYWGSFKYDGEKIYIGDPTALQGRMNDLVNMGGNIVLESEKLLNTTELPTKSERVADKALVGKFYAQSFFLIHYFNSSVELRTQLQNYMGYLSSGYRESQAFSKAFGITYAELDKNAKAYLKKSLLMRVISYSDGSISFPKPVISVSKLAKPGFYREISDILPLFGFMERATTKQLLEQNIALNPTNTDAKMKLLAYGLTDNPQKLEKEIEQLTPQHPLLLTYRGDGLREGANLLRRAGLPGWEEQMKKARSQYRRAIKTDPSLARAYAGLGDVYNFLPDSEPLQEGLVGWETASLYEREAQSFAELADMMLRMNKGVEALPALRNAVAFSSEKEKSHYSLILDSLEILHDASTLVGEVTPTGLRYSGGSDYVGQVSNDKPQGQGKFTRPNGSYYEGNFVNGAMQGQGKLITYGGFEYSGEFQQGIARGKGKLVYPEAVSSYQGDVFYAIPFGKGVATFKDKTYEGDYWFSFPQGKGTVTSKDGKLKLEGRWVYGLYEWPEAQGVQFVGGYSDDGKRNGKGLCLTKEPRKIEVCEYKDGAREQSDKTVAQAK